MAAQTWEVLLNWNLNNAADGAANGGAGSSAVLNDISPAPQLQIPVNFLTVGSTLRVTASGVFTNTATPTLGIGVYYGGIAGTALAASTPVTTIVSAVAWSWRFVYEGTVRTNGSTGTIMGSGMLWMPASLTQAQAPYFAPATAPAAVTIDTTAQKALTIGAIWGTANAANLVTLKKFLVESVA